MFWRGLFLAAVPDVDTEVIDKERQVSAKKPMPAKEYMFLYFGEPEILFSLVLVKCSHGQPCLMAQGRLARPKLSSQFRDLIKGPMR